MPGDHAGLVPEQCRAGALPADEGLHDKFALLDRAAEDDLVIRAEDAVALRADLLDPPVCQVDGQQQRYFIGAGAALAGVDPLAPAPGRVTGDHNLLDTAVSHISHGCPLHKSVGKDDLTISAVQQSVTRVKIILNNKVK